MGKKGKKRDDENDLGTSGSKEESIGTPVDFIIRTMIERDPRKRRVKPVDRTSFESIPLFEDTSSDDDDYQPIKGKDADDDDDDDDDDNDSDDEDENDSSSGDSDKDSDDSDSDRKIRPAARIQSEESSSSQSTKVVIKKEPKREKSTASNNINHAIASNRTGHDYGNQLENRLDSHSNERFSSIMICAVCCGDQSHDADEIVECDSCSITVHENCYGIIAGEAESESVHSTISSCSTEPWFCDACKANVAPKDLTCELCPNTRGIFKQTDTGRWVHVVCALYTTGVAFSDTIHLSGITLSEVAPERWGAKSCSLCEDERFARTGITVSCDAGLCKTYFHVTCAQREGLLQEVEETDVVDPFIAHCKIHAADRHVVKMKKRNFLSLQSRIRFKSASHPNLMSSRTQKKLDHARHRWQTHLLFEPPSQAAVKYSPNRKVPRMLTTSPAAVRILTKKADLMGYSQSAHALMIQAANALDIRKKWNVAPAFSVEFVSYFIDRNSRINEMRNRLQELQSQESSLKRQEAEVMKVMQDVMPQYETMKKNSMKLREEARSLWNKLVSIGKDDSVRLPHVFETPVKEKRNSNHTTGSASAVKKLKMSISQELEWKECGLCSKSSDQHLLALCDSCRLHFHLYCLDPPLTRMPKKTRFGGWQCSDCTDLKKQREIELMDDPMADVDNEDNDEESRRRSRSRRGPDKYVPDPEKSAAVNISPGTKRRGRPPLTEKQKRMKLAAKKRSKQKVRVEVSLDTE